VNEVTTLRRHQEAAHRGDYLKWAKSNNFVSMLPKDAKRRREDAAADQQSSINGHLKPRVPNERVIQYTDALFREAATQWLIDTDQPIEALEHPAFKNMVDIAARATNGVILPDRRQTRRAIIDLFKQNLTNLCKRLLVCVPFLYSSSLVSHYILE
ncbi:hypothetical protein P692DRAFT_201719774, partial [Suillus brevipes Sb2]